MRLIITEGIGPKLEAKINELQFECSGNQVAAAKALLKKCNLAAKKIEAKGEATIFFDIGVWVDVMDQADELMTVPLLPIDSDALNLLN